MTLNMVAISVMPPLFGVIVDGSGYAYAWSALSLIVLAAIVYLWRGAAKAELARANKQGSL
jgi:fucose permease